MRGVNKVIIVGTMGSDPKLITTNSGHVSEVSLATSEEWKDKSTGEDKKLTEWHKVVCYNRLAEIVCQYAKTGSKLYVEGSLRTTKYTDKDGVEKYSTKIMASNLQFLSSKNEEQQRPLLAAQGQDSSSPRAYNAASRGGNYNSGLPF